MNKSDVKIFSVTSHQYVWSSGEQVKKVRNRLKWWNWLSKIDYQSAVRSDHPCIPRTTLSVMYHARHDKNFWTTWYGATHPSRQTRQTRQTRSTRPIRPTRPTRPTRQTPSNFPTRLESGATPPTRPFRPTRPTRPSRPTPPTRSTRPIRPIRPTHQLAISPTTLANTR